MCDASVYAAQVVALAEFDPLALPGYGDARSLAEMACRALDSAPPRVSLVGHSMGARVALEMVRIAPERVERLALLDTGVHPVRPGEADKRYALLALGREKGIGALVDEWLPPMVGPALRHDPAFLAPLRRMATAGGVERYAAQIEALLGRPDQSLQLSQIACPTLVGVGRQDDWSGLAQHEAIAGAIPGAELAVFENAGHFAPLEAPDQVSAALLRWMDRLA
jgi:pimeloyl-ACP methyl ester carboxylesterase